MPNVTLCNFIWVFLFGVIINEVTPRSSLSPDTLTVNSSNNDFGVTPQIPEDAITEIFSLASSTLESLEDIEEEYEDEDASTVPPEITTTTLGSQSSSTLPPEISRDAECPVNLEAGILVKCRCQGDEILVDGLCQHYPNGTFIPAEKDFIKTVEVPVTNYKVIIRDVICDPGKSHLLQFTKGQFRLRYRRDLVLLESAGDLHGQRINNYCVSHHMDNLGNLTVTMKACVPIPAVPRCCPPSQAMKDGSCQPANTPDSLMPPIGAKPFYKSVEWPNITNYLSPLTCTNDPVKTIPLSYKASHLVSLPAGLKLTWVPDVTSRPKYYSYPDYCIDGIKNSNGSANNYFTSFCYSKPKEHHERVCTGRSCVRKCCKWGQVMDVNLYGCAPSTNASFNPPTVEDLANYNFVIGWPLCKPATRTNGTINIDKSGFLTYKDRIFPPTDYCVDTFVNDDACEVGVLACQSVTTLWQEIRPILFPVCNIISLFFLVINIACHLMVPKLLKNGGMQQLCHSIALAIAYLFSVIANLSVNNLTRMSCFPIAIMMQFGYLATFFWLNVMCFEIWRKIRRLLKFRSCKSYPIWYYMMYAWGIPIVICVTTVLMQLFAPENVPGLIKPYIGYSTCWFKEEIALFIYFYGPIAALFACNTIFLGLTFYNYLFVLQSHHKETTKCFNTMNGKVNSGSACGSSSSAQKPTSKKQSRQPTDHPFQDFKQQFLLFLLMATCWVSEIFSWKIPPPEFWSLTDTMNCLQGFFIFIILLSNRNKYRQLKEQFSQPFKLAHK